MQRAPFRPTARRHCPVQGAKLDFAGPHKTIVRLTATQLAMLEPKRMLDEDVVEFGLWYACQGLLTC